MSSKRSQTSSSNGSPSPPESSSKEQDRFLPIANVSRIMKKSLPPNAKISKEAKETVQECVSEFISFVTGEASDKCQREKRKTVNGDDLLWAMTTLGFENYVSALKGYLNKYREVEGDKSKNDIVGKTTDQLGFRDFDQGDPLYSLWGQVNNGQQKSREDTRSVVVGYGGEKNDNDIGDGNAGRAMESHLQHGIGW